ncbi:hypothetical protein [uncultured Rhodoblastus sp.]|uniref:hypothetical protein n=1 Tax=uncultured Rhodoblastus sp. TaxID=543037 RepID=UPI0025E8745F|nr:hypothetical protein [uncultured Rhodoblastus sp.]
MSAPNDRLELFVALSAALTGVKAFRLRGTGQAEAYLAAVEAIVPWPIIDDLFSQFAALPAGDALEPALESGILADPRLGAVARNLILLWYRGAWSQLPPAWRASFGSSAGDTNHVISSAAYQAGLQWEIAGAHPVGARQQGYGSWALLPAGEDTP